MQFEEKAEMRNDNSSPPSTVPTSGIPVHTIKHYCDGSDDSAAVKIPVVVHYVLYILKYLYVAQSK